MERKTYNLPNQLKTVSTYYQNVIHLQAAKTLVNKGYDPEIIDICSLKPFDMDTIGQSVKKTHRVLIVEECMGTGGIGASLRATMNLIPPLVASHHRMYQPPVLVLWRS
jgi:pyruvate dehydrogenase E1 component beta subunit